MTTPSPSPWAGVVPPPPWKEVPDGQLATAGDDDHPATDRDHPITGTGHDMAPPVELRSDRAVPYEPPGPYEPISAWSGPSAYQSAAGPSTAARPARPPPATTQGGLGPPSPPAAPAPAAPTPRALEGNNATADATDATDPTSDAAAPGWIGNRPVGSGTSPERGRFDPGDLVRSRPPAPDSGIRRALYRLTAGRVNLGPSAGEAAHRRLVERARTPAVTGRRRIAMISLKGGVGKTTTTVMLGHALASVRGDNVIAIDANPDAGNLASRIRRQTDRSARDLLNASESLERYADVRSFTSQADSRLEVLAGESDPALSEAFSASDYEAVLAALERFYSIVLTDCGTGILHDAMRAVLWYVDQLIVVTSPAVDSAHALGQLLDWLDQHGHHHLVQGAIVVVNGVRKRSEIRVDQFAATFGTRCRGVVTVPYDSALATGGEASLEALGSPTRGACLELAAAVGDGFSQPRRHGHDPGRRRG